MNFLSNSLKIKKFKQNFIMIITITSAVTIIITAAIPIITST